MNNYPIHTAFKILPLIASAMLLGSCGKEQVQATPRPAVPVVFGEVESGRVSDGTEYNVSLVSREIANVRPRVSGNILERYVDLGDRVTAGQRMFIIDPIEQQAAVNSQLAQVGSATAAVETAKSSLQSAIAERARIATEKDLNSARADWENAKSTLLSQEAELDRRQAQLDYQTLENERYQSLADNGAVSQETADQTERSYLQAQADVENQNKVIEAAQATVVSTRRAYDRLIASVDAQLAAQDQVIAGAKAEIARAQQELQRTRQQAAEQEARLGFYEINAPFSGTVGNVPVNVGDFVDSQTLLATVSQSQPLEVLIQIPIDRLSQVRIGTRIELQTQQNEPIGVIPVSFISPQTDAETQTITIKGIYANAENQLRTDQLVKAKVVWEDKSSVTIPTTAVTRIGDQAFVFVVNESEGKTVATQTPVTLGSITEQSFVVQDGLQGGETIVTEGVVKLRDGAPVVDASTLPSSSENGE
ncbi:MAG: efflux RND transporter periplasmic adaptor subunit [Roseofilum sp. SBFL]|uniref:efflux RND transporter periplasmic adaptor subunit n=1 Tax=unclassified Roseofilum TaxID=2620099 RepID=UPI001B05810C|nr:MULTISPECIES: efflux RND transporter periplasmic adaptor subunit [unclassified Roseofilum]MBP0013732.1 efflux RND transporter periplasmic adaptor subunit [Roseofilum sp. SID3]MBP0024124.1 efflux RND transporter periplasmic adaptor subunit [Roseofilum sp. SID2]MBP0037520.1 efflux RND transporter periplasmic adaptor subunit [Roseofilum sp. SID1]MBP0042863.1 efflux RND transporter periplasmic adaptor subunit [Roseofilum sp. SBFL]